MPTQTNQNIIDQKQILEVTNQVMYQRTRIQRSDLQTTLSKVPAPWIVPASIISNTQEIKFLSHLQWAGNTSQRSCQQEGIPSHKWKLVLTIQREKKKKGRGGRPKVNPFVSRMFIKANRGSFMASVVLSFVQNNSVPFAAIQMMYPLSFIFQIYHSIKKHLDFCSLKMG